MQDRIRLPQCGSRAATLVVLLLVLFLLPNPAPVLSQQIDCADVIANLERAIQRCDEMNNNYACYGSRFSEAIPLLERFERPGDRVPFAATDRITTDEAGAVLMYLSVGDEDPVKIITFGAAALDSSRDPDAPNSFFVTTDGDNLLCEETPPGLVVYTDDGEAGTVNINGVNIELHSAAYIALDNAGGMTVSNLTGSVDVAAGGIGVSVPVSASVQIDNPVDAPDIIEQPGVSDLSRSPVAQWLINDPNGLPRIRNLNETILSCSRDQVQVPTTLELQNYDPGQECLIRFCANEGDTISIQMEALDDDIDPWIDLRGPDQRLVVFNNDVRADENNAAICNQTLPTEGCYTVVARTRNNETAGKFFLNLDHGTTCEEPEPECEVVSQIGLRLRSGPSTDTEIVRSLPLGTDLIVQASDINGAWYNVRTADTNEEGWVWHNDLVVACSGDGIPVAIITPTATATATTTAAPPPTTPTPTPRPNDPPPPPPPVLPNPEPPKQSPFGEP